MNGPTSNVASAVQLFEGLKKYFENSINEEHYNKNNTKTSVGLWYFIIQETILCQCDDSLLQASDCIFSSLWA